jgi:hypothetical protein
MIGSPKLIGSADSGITLDDIMLIRWNRKD